MVFFAVFYIVSDIYACNYSLSTVEFCVFPSTLSGLRCSTYRTWFAGDEAFSLILVSARRNMSSWWAYSVVIHTYIVSDRLWMERMYRALLDIFSSVAMLRYSTN